MNSNGKPHGHEHGHSHGSLDPGLLSHDKALWAVKWSFFGLLATAIFQGLVVAFSHSVALWADTIHNFADAGTSIPLAVAFMLGKRRPTRRYTYGYGRFEDFAGLLVIVFIFLSALLAGYESIRRLFHPREMEHVGVVIAASLVGFAGNEAVALFRIRVGRQIASAALVADGQHARIDGLTSLSVSIGAAGAWLGWNWADPAVGLVITVVLFHVVWDASKEILMRLLDGIEPEILEEMEHAARHVPGVMHVTEVRAKWIGHKIHAELNVTVGASLSVAQGHEIARQVKHELLHHVEHLSNAIIHVDPETASGEAHHHMEHHDSCSRGHAG